MTEPEYKTHCAWCRAELNGRFVTVMGPWEAYSREDAVRYCSSKCATARRDTMFHRTKVSGREKWVRYQVEIPPELAAMLDETIKAQLGVNVSSFSRANVTRRALRALLNEVAPIPEPPIDSTASDVIDLPALPPWTDLPVLEP